MRRDRQRDKQRAEQRKASRSNVILIGYRGTGKTTLARLLADRLNMSAWDSDPEIVRRAGKSIAEIFAEQGEAAFRDLEADTIADLIRLSEAENQSFVLATGGGAILRPETRQLLRRAGHVIWLTASPETILKRIRDDDASVATRPNLTALPALEEIVTLLELRHPLYRETAHRTIDTDSVSPDEIVPLLETVLNDRIDIQDAP